MVNVTDMGAFRRKKTAERFESAWRFLFGESYANSDGFPGIPNHRLLFLTEPDDETVNEIYSLINRSMSGARTIEFNQLEMVFQLKIVDIHLFLADRCRFEMMRRLSWLERYVGDDLTLVDMILDFGRLRDEDLDNPPVLSTAHERYEEFQNLITREKSVFVRKLYPSAVTAFKELF